MATRRRTFYVHSVPLIYDCWCHFIHRVHILCFITYILPMRKVKFTTRHFIATRKLSTFIFQRLQIKWWTNTLNVMAITNGRRKTGRSVPRNGAIASHRWNNFTQISLYHMTSIVYNENSSFWTLKKVLTDTQMEMQDQLWCGQHQSRVGQESVSIRIKCTMIVVSVARSLNQTFVKSLFIGFVEIVRCPIKPPMSSWDIICEHFVARLAQGKYITYSANILWRCWLRGSI